jgi:NAD+ synthase
MHAHQLEEIVEFPAVGLHLVASDEGNGERFPAPTLQLQPLSLEREILLPEIDDFEFATRELGDYVIETVKSVGSTGCVIGLSGGADSTMSAAVIKHAFDRYNAINPDKPLELVGYILPSDTNDPQDTKDGISVAERLGVRYEVQSIEGIVDAYRTTNPEAFESKFDQGNMMSRIRGNVLNTKAATERKSVAGTGNKDEDYGIGYFTLFGDGAVHFNVPGELSKRLVFQMLEYHDFDDIAARTPTAGLEPGQSDFKDLGYHYDVVEMVMEGTNQEFSPQELAVHSQVTDLVNRDVQKYQTQFGEAKFSTAGEVVNDILKRHNSAKKKSEIIHAPAAPVTLNYDNGGMRYVH